MKLRQIKKERKSNGNGKRVVMLVTILPSGKLAKQKNFKIKAKNVPLTPWKCFFFV